MQALKHYNTNSTNLPYRRRILQENALQLAKTSSLFELLESHICDVQ